LEEGTADSGDVEGEAETEEGAARRVGRRGSERGGNGAEGAGG